MDLDALGDPQASFPDEPLPLYGLPPEVECQRDMPSWQRGVSTQMGPGTNGITVCVSAEAGLKHHRGAQRLGVVTFAPAESMTPDDLLYREQPGSRRHGMLPRVTGAPVACAILVDGAPVDFAGYEIPGLTVLLAGRSGHAIGVVSRDWPLADVSLVRITDFAPHESLAEY